MTLTTELPQPTLTTELPQPTLTAGALVATVSGDGASAVVTLRGEADLFTLPVVNDVLTRVIDDSDGPVIVDLAPTDFIDAATVGALARAGAFLDERGRALTVRSPSRMAARVLDLCGLSHVIEPDRMPAT